MTIYEWLNNKIVNSTTINPIIGTKCLPDYLPSTETPPAVVYYDVSFSRNRIERGNIISVKAVHNSKSSMETLNGHLYDLFDNSTGWIRESSSNLYVDSVEIINNAASGYDETNRNWWRDLELSIFYRIGG